METGISNDPVSIRKPELTSSEHFSVVGEEDGDGYGNTPDGLTLFIPPEELSRYDIAKTVKDNYNYVLIRDMIVNDYEWMRREMVDLGLELEDPDEGIDTDIESNVDDVMVKGQRGAKKSTKAETDADGCLSFDGFKGNYTLTVGSRVMPISLKEDMTQVRTLVVP